MRRLLAMVKKITPLTPEKEDALSSQLEKLMLQPGESIPLDVPAKSWIFVEEGFLMLMQCMDRQWVCSNFYYEGVGTVFYNVGAAELAENSFQVQAVELSTVYYLTPAHQEQLLPSFPAFPLVRSAINMRSYGQSQARCELHHVEDDAKVSLLEDHFPFLLRAPAERLSEWLRLKNKRQRMEMVAAKRRYEAGRQGSTT
jgi:hypothetical protein